MVNVIDVYNAVRDLCNKDQRGFVTPEVFSTFAGIAQQNVFNEMFQELLVANKSRKAGIDPARDKSMYKMIEEDLAYFITNMDLSDAAAQPDDWITDPDSADYVGEYVDPADEGASTFSKPLDLARIISIRSTEGSTNLDLVYNSETAERILTSNLSAPTLAFPVAIISNVIEVFPFELNAIRLKYYRQPKSINAYDYSVDITSTPVYIEMSMGGAITVPDMLNSRHFELPDHYKNELIVEIAKMIGIRLRDSYLSSFAISEEKAE
tara:strand:+ start:17097 stop:17894 length:798 start_codon:yes stop_codon:yes gene_type:complete